MLKIIELVPPRQPKIKMADLHVDYMGILSTQSVTDKTEAMMAEIDRQLAKIKGLEIESDDYGNCYVTKGVGPYPTFVCHTDTVHPIKDNFQVCRTEDGRWFAMSAENEKLEQVGIGGDDKCGIILCLELLHRLKNVRCAFFLDEERGCKGSTAGDLTFFDNSRYAIQIDRRNGGDIITTGSGTVLCSTEFKDMMNQLGKTYGYSSTIGLNTDVVKLKERGMGISACNLSAGYYAPHSKQEFIKENELLNCLEFCIAIARIKTVYPHKYEKPKVTAISRPKSLNAFCEECKDELPWLDKDDKLCKTCIKDALEDKFLCRNGNEIYLEKKIQLPAVILPHLPLSKCSICQEEMELVEHQDRGYCSNHPDICACDARITSWKGLLAGACEKHLRIVDADVGIIQDERCEGNTCGNILNTAKEQFDGLCEVCSKEWGEGQKKCKTKKCKNLLVLEEEYKKGICNFCTPPRCPQQISMHGVCDMPLLSLEEVQRELCDTCYAFIQEAYTQKYAI